MLWFAVLAWLRQNYSADADFAGGFHLDLAPEEAVPGGVTFRGVRENPIPAFEMAEEAAHHDEECRGTIVVYAADDERLVRMVAKLKAVLRRPVPAADPAVVAVEADRGEVRYRREPYRGKQAQPIFSAEMDYVFGYTMREQP